MEVPFETSIVPLLLNEKRLVMLSADGRVMLATHKTSKEESFPSKSALDGG